MDGDGINVSLTLQGYYDRPQETKDTLSEDGWFKTGDLFYRNDNSNYVFVERAKMLLKYRSHQVILSTAAVVV